MAEDTAGLLAVQASPDDGVRARVYEWESPAVTLGRSTPADRIDLAALAGAGIQVARRPTGGGVLVHGGDVSFSVAAPDAVRLPRDPIAAGRRLAWPALSALRVLGFDASFRDEPRARCAGAPPGLCSLQRSGLDLLVAGFKVAAFAQRRVRGAVLQHGSVFVEPIPARVGAALVAAGAATAAEWALTRGAVRALADWQALERTRLREALLLAMKERLHNGF